MKNILIIFLSFFLSCCNKPKNENIINVGTSADNPPYEFIINNEIIGYDIDLIKMIGKELGYEVKIHNMDFNNLIAALSTKKLDLAIAAFSISEERKKHIEYSIPYIKAKISFLVETGVTEENLYEQKIGVQLGTVGTQILDSIKKTSPKMTIINLSNNNFLVQELKSGRIKAILIDNFQAKQFMKQNPNLKILPLNTKDVQSDFAITFPKNSPLVDKINEAIIKLKDEGKLLELENKWFSGSE